MCESGKHEVMYRIACDDDDKATIDFLKTIAYEFPFSVRIGPRPATLGSVANDLAAHWPADVYQVFADDLACITYGWDEVLAAAVEKTPHGVFWWKSARTDESLVPAVTEAWRVAAGGIFTEYFPFWYDDLWLRDLWIMTTDENQIYLDAFVVDKPIATHRMRDLKFWADFFCAMKWERVKHGKRIAANLGLPEPLIGEPFAKRFYEAAPAFDEKWAAKIEKMNRAETDPPSEQYLETKARAEELMRKAA